MTIQLNHTERQGFTVVCPEGDLTMYHVYPARKYIESLLEKRVRRMALDFSRLNTLDSAGVGMLLKIHRQMIDYRGDLFIFGCPLSITKVLHTLKLDDLIPIHDTFEAGVSQIKGNP